MIPPRIVTLRPDTEAAAIREAAAVLADGRLVVMPTETVYGVAAHADIPLALERLFEAKGRDRDKPIPLLAANLEAVEEYGALLNDVERKLAARFWPGALTLVLAVGSRTEGFRVPDHRVARRLVEAAGGVLRVTSANLSGEPPALTAAAAVQALGGCVAAVLDDGPVRGGVPSTVVRVERRDVRILRAGAIEESELRNILS